MNNPSLDSHDTRLFDYNGWMFWPGASEAEQDQQLERQRALLARTPGEIGERTFLSELAMIEPDRLVMGARCYIAAHAYVTGELTTGDDCTINVFAVVRGLVKLGDAVRVGAHTSILGFNHGMEPDRPVFRQPLQQKGITIGDDVWIGSNVVIVDGVTIGSHAVIGAGSVVTRDVDEWAIVAGNPARLIRDRRAPRGQSAVQAAESSLAVRLAAFADTARSEIADVLARSWEPAEPDEDRGDGRYLDAPKAPPTRRAHADAVELAILLTGTAPAQLSRDDHIARLKRGQDPDTGLSSGSLPSVTAGASATFAESPHAHYDVLSLGHALDLLGSRFDAPIETVERMSPSDVIDFLDAQPYATSGWGAGAAVDAIGTAIAWNLRYGEGDAARGRAQIDTVIGWLTTHAYRATGMWSPARLSDGLLQPVNGFYRATRGTFAQFGQPLPYPVQTIDTVFAHTADSRHFGPGRTTACNVLDIAHPLWLARRQTHYRADEIRALAIEWLPVVLDEWVPGSGFPFQFPALGGPRNTSQQPGLQGTEMWLATVWYLADLAGVSESLGYRPRGVHRPEPAIDLEA